MLALSSEEIYVADTNRSWQDLSPIISTLSNEEGAVARIFVKEKFDEMKEYRTRARAIWKEISNDHQD